MKGTGVGPLRRLAAYVVDWYLATMLCGAPLLLVNSMRTGEQTLDTSLPPDAPGWLWGSTVSYTHLDVYKRQVDRSLRLVERAGLGIRDRFQIVALGCAAERDQLKAGLFELFL